MLTLIAEAFRIWVREWQLAWHSHNRVADCLCLTCVRYRRLFWGEQGALFEADSV